MKKIITLILAICMAASFTACNNEESSEKDKADSSESISSTDESSDSKKDSGDIFGKPYESAISDFFKFYETGDAQDYKKTVLPYKLAFMEKAGGDEFDADAYCKEEAENIKEYFEDKFGKNIKITYEIKKDKELTQDKLDEIAQDMKDKYEADVVVESAYKVKVSAKVKGDEDEGTDVFTVTVAKTDGSWYIIEGIG